MNTRRSFLRSTALAVYGPTEATIISSVLEIQAADVERYRELFPVPIGKTVGNTRLLVLNQGLKLCPVNVPGELYITGDALARGYLNNPELTAEKFIHLTLNSQQVTLYKTGDLVRWLPGGDVEFLGRIDNQVKVRGYRIELGEIENRLMDHDSINETVVTVKENTGGEKYLCAYIVTGGDLQDEEIKAFLSTRLLLDGSQDQSILYFCS